MGAGGPPGYPPQVAPRGDNRRILLLGGGLVALAVVLTVVAALSGAARDGGAEAGERLAKPRLLWTSLDCPPGAPGRVPA